MIIIDCVYLIQLYTTVNNIKRVTQFTQLVSRVNVYNLFCRITVTNRFFKLTFFKFLILYTAPPRAAVDGL